MSVPYFKRSVSKLEYHYHFKKRVQKVIIDLLKENFKIPSQYIIDGIGGTPMWLIEQKRKEILKSLNIIATYLARARFTPKNLKEANTKIEYQNRSIQECRALYDNIQFCFEIFSVGNGNRLIKTYSSIKQAITDEITYIKYWRKYVQKIECNGLK